MIYGTGIDIIEIERIKKSVEQFGEHFLNKIFTQTELDYSLSKKNKYQHLAARFATKEAIIKAVSSSKAPKFGWKDMEIYNEENGVPKVKLFGTLKNFLTDEKGLQISMSHSHNYVTAFAILYKKNN